MRNRSLFLLLLSTISLLILTGCQNSTLKATSTNIFSKDSISIKVEPYTQTLHQQVNIDPLFYELNLNTTFLVSITNMTDIPIQTFLEDTFVLQDKNKKQYRIIKDPFNFIKNSFKNNTYTDMSYVDLKNVEIQTGTLLNEKISSDNIDYYQSELNDLKEKIYLLEQNQMFKDEIMRREKSIKNKLETHGFKDQIIYSQGTYQGLIVFPPINIENLSNSTLYFTSPGNEVVTINFSLQTAN